MMVMLALCYCFLTINYYNENHLQEDGEIYQVNLGLFHVFLKMYIY